MNNQLDDKALTNEQISHFFKCVLLAHMSGLFTIKPTYGQITWGVLTDLAFDMPRDKDSVTTEMKEAVKDIVNQVKPFCEYLRTLPAKGKQRGKRRLCKSQRKK